MDLHLAGRTVLITGAASGIGRATAQAMADEGARLVLIDVDEPALAETARLVAPDAEGSAPITVTGELSTAAGADQAMTDALAATNGAVDVLVSNAGRCQFRALDDLTDEDWLNTMAVNLLATVRAVRLVVPAMRARGDGAIVITTSDLARQPERSPADYAASKAALTAYAKTLALDGAPHIRVNAVAPGPIWTGLWSRPGGLADNLAKLHDMPPREAVDHEMRLRRLPLARIGEPEEVAAVICFLASDRASYVTAATWDVGGGSVRGLF
jgi:NAD(P)-dependent dehydrogenase (short-subunit alcohol dehydrogenase family)